MKAFFQARIMASDLWAQCKFIGYTAEINDNMERYCHATQTLRLF
ncbi:hypothetical protein ALT785_30024 [Alteromonas infernus]